MGRPGSPTSSPSVPPGVIVCRATFHVIGWATKALEEVCRVEGNMVCADGAKTRSTGL